MTANIICYDLVPRKATIWTRARKAKLAALIDQCGETLCRTIIARELGLSSTQVPAVNRQLATLGVRKPAWT